MDEWEAIQWRRLINDQIGRAANVKEEVVGRIALVWMDVVIEHPDENGLLIRLEELLSYLNPKWRDHYVPYDETDRRTDRRTPGRYQDGQNIDAARFAPDALQGDPTYRRPDTGNSRQDPRS